MADRGGSLLKSVWSSILNPYLFIGKIVLLLFISLFLIFSLWSWFLKSVKSTKLCILPCSSDAFLDSVSYFYSLSTRYRNACVPLGRSRIHVKSWPLLCIGIVLLLNVPASCTSAPPRFHLNTVVTVSLFFTFPSSWFCIWWMAKSFKLTVTELSLASVLIETPLSGKLLSFCDADCPMFWSTLSF